jgi:hypothetical protein
MKSIAVLLALTALLAIASAASTQERKERVAVAVFDFRPESKTLNKEASLLSEMARVALGQKQDLRIVSREDLMKILEEQKMGMAGITEEAAPKIGALVGAQALVVGKVFDSEGGMTVTYKVIATETGRSFSSLSKGKPSDAEAIGKEIGAGIADIISKNKADLFASPDKDDSAMEKIVEKIGKNAMPRVFVSIPEQIIGVTPPDPAAQTEIEYMLKKIGCTIVKDRDGMLQKWADSSTSNTSEAAALKSVDIIFRGEAVGQFASRTGDFTSSRGRIELEALDPHTGKVLAVDRETQAAADLAEIIAAKGAIQKAADKLGKRLIPEALEAWHKSVNTK